MKQISNFKKSIPDGERFLQEPLSQCSCRRANAYIGGHLPPVEGKLPDATELHIGITFKIDPRLLHQADQKPIQPGQLTPPAHGMRNEI